MLEHYGDGTRRTPAGLEPATCPVCWGIGLNLVDGENEIVLCAFCGGTGLRPLEPPRPAGEDPAPRTSRYIVIALILFAAALAVAVMLVRGL